MPPPSSVADWPSATMFAATPWAMIGACVIESWSWLATMGWRT